MLSIAKMFYRNKFLMEAVRCYSASSKHNFETLAVSVPSPYVHHVELNRPKEMNAFNLTMWRDIKSCFKALNDDPECRVIVLSGRGKHFTAGLDLSSLMQWQQTLQQFEDIARKVKAMATMIEDMQDCISSLEECEKPVLAAVHRACIGAGVDLVTAADVRYCTEDAFFQVKEVDIGLAADVGTLQRLPKVINSMSAAREICFTARRVDAAEAKSLGLVSKVFPDQQSAVKTALEVAASIAKKSPVAVQNTKISMVYSLSRPNQKGLDHIRHINASALMSEDVIKSGMAQMTKEDLPDFEKY